MRTTSIWLTSLALSFCSQVQAASPLSCGQYSPSAAINPSSNLALTATAMLASPGAPYLPGQIVDAAWFLMDQQGTGALMGCAPKRSVIQGWSQQNFYNSNNTLKSISAQRFGSDETVPLSFAYQSDSSYYLTAAENFCMSINADKVRYDMSYSKGKLTGMVQTPDSGCPSTAVISVAFDYASAEVPGLPTTMTVSQAGKADEISTYDYKVDDGLIQSVAVKSAGQAFTIAYSYSDAQISGMTYAGASFTLAYQDGSQWKNMIDPRYRWGLTIDYLTSGKIESTLQNTGDPGAQPEHYYY